jgi:hypothetical protein
MLRDRMGKQKRRPRRLLESDARDWARWNAAAKIEGVNWSTFARRALMARVAYVGELEEAAEREPALRVMVPGADLVRKTSAKKASRKPTKKARRSRG